MTLFFFFSSRRRHTRYWRDWSSDVCSSDLKAEIMNLIAPLGQVYHAGTLSGNPISVRAGYETLSYLIQHRAEVYSSITEKTDFLVKHIKQLIQQYKIPAIIQSIPSLFTIFFSSKERITNLEDA